LLFTQLSPCCKMEFLYAKRAKTLYFKMFLFPERRKKVSKNCSKTAQNRLPTENVKTPPEWWILGVGGKGAPVGETRCLWMGPFLGSRKSEGACNISNMDFVPRGLVAQTPVLSAFEPGFKLCIFAELITQANVVSILT
jgi:hypothetical protein